jgi:hypothetical protein
MNDPELDELAGSESDRRTAERRKWLVSVQFEGGDATGIAQTADISLGGLYLTTDAELAQGTEIFLKLEVGGRQTGIEGTVAYADKGRGLGVRFKGLSEEAETVLKTQLGLD